MTDARLRGEWLNALKFDDLSDTAWRVFTGALMWSAENGTNGRIPDRYTKMLHPDGSKPEAAQELVNAGLWASESGAYRLVDWDGALGQSTAEQVETYKANGRKRARTYREGQRQKLAKVVGFVDAEGSPVMRDVASDVTRDVREYVGKGEGTGKGSGYVSTNTDEEPVNHNTGEVDLPKPSVTCLWWRSLIRLRLRPLRAPFLVARIRSFHLSPKPSACAVRVAQLMNRPARARLPKEKQCIQKFSVTAISGVPSRRGAVRAKR